jgi:hypothetical protein
VPKRDAEVNAAGVMHATRSTLRFLEHPGRRAVTAYIACRYVDTSSPLQLSRWPSRKVAAHGRWGANCLGTTNAGCVRPWEWIGWMGDGMEPTTPIPPCPRYFCFFLTLIRPLLRLARPHVRPVKQHAIHTVTHCHTRERAPSPSSRACLCLLANKVRLSGWGGPKRSRGVKDGGVKWQLHACETMVPENTHHSQKAPDLRSDACGLENRQGRS